MTENAYIRTPQNIENALNSPPCIVNKKTNFEDKLALFYNSIQYSWNKQIRQLKKDTDDEDLNIYISTLPMVKTLNMDQKIIFRIQVMKLLQSLHLKVLRSTNNIIYYNFIFNFC